MGEMTNTEKKQLINLVKRAIGKNTQAEFAKKAGISAFNLSRILSSGNQKPQRSTLCKIAEASEGRVTERQLFIACGYERQKPCLPTDPDDTVSTCVDIIEDLVDGAKQMTGTAMKYASIEDFLENLKLERIKEWHHTDCWEEHKYKGMGHKNAEMLWHTRFHYILPELNIYICVAMTLFFCKTKEGGYIFSDVAFDMETLLNTDHPYAKQVLFEQAKKGDLDYGKIRVVFSAMAIKDNAKQQIKDILADTLREDPE